MEAVTGTEKPPSPREEIVLEDIKVRLYPIKVKLYPIKVRLCLIKVRLFEIKVPQLIEVPQQRPTWGQGPHPTGTTGG